MSDVTLSQPTAHVLTSRRSVLLGGAALGIAATGLCANDAHAASGATTSATQTVGAYPLARETGDTRTFQALSASNLNPTGFYLAPGVELTVKVTRATATTHRLVVGAPDAEVDPAKQTPREYALKVGTVKVTDPHGGPIYFKVIGAKGYLTATIGKEASRMPYYIHGSTSEGEFQDQIDNRNTPYAELVSAHTLITVQKSAIERFRGEDHAALMATFEEVIAAEDRLAGLDDTTATDARLPYRYHFVTRGESIAGIGAYATHGHMLFPAPIQEKLLTVDGLRLSGWGMYHELGHQHQQTVYKPIALTESTVNLYSLAVNRDFAKYGQAPALHVLQSGTGESYWGSAVPKIGSEGVNFLTTFGLFEQLVMYEQLRLHYGAGFYPKVQQAGAGREAAARGDRRQPLPAGHAGALLQQGRRAGPARIPDQVGSVLGGPPSTTRSPR